MLNICLLSDPNSQDDPYSEHRKLFSTVTIPSKYLCPKSLRGIFYKNLTNDNKNDKSHEQQQELPLKILFFHGHEITQFLSSSDYPTDGKHYGLPLFMMLQRSLQGVIHEYAKMTSSKSTKSLTALVEKENENKLIHNLWIQRLRSCYNELLPNFKTNTVPAFENMRDDKK